MNQISDIERSKSFWGWAVIISGLGIVLPPMTGLIGTAFGMVKAFGTLKAAGAADPSALAGDISIALLTTLWGLVFSTIALIPFVISLVQYKKKSRLCSPLQR